MKTLIDVLLAAFALAVFAPLMALLGVIVKITSPGPVLIRQKRVGLYGIPFTIYKFRTMVQDAHLIGTSVTTGNDPRITKVGRFLRKSKLDELPQLVNILKRDMSFVGPRPDVPEIIENYTQEMRRVLTIKPGITSLATIHFRDEEGLLSQVPNPDEFYAKVVVPLKVKLAMEHVEKNSLLFDLKILAQTVWMITPLGRLFPVMENPLVTELKRRSA